MKWLFDMALAIGIACFGVALLGFTLKFWWSIFMFGWNAI